MQNCFVIGKARSGTTVFKEMLASHPHIVNFGEIFNESNKLSFFEFLKRQALVDPNLLMPSKSVEAFRRYVAECMEKAVVFRSKAKIMVMDIKYEQFHFVYNAWQNVNDVPVLLGLMRSEGWSVIDMRRRNILDMIISNEVAVQTGVYHINADGHREQTAKIRLEPTQIEGRIKSIRQAYRMVSSVFAGYEKYQELIYEDLFDSSDCFDSSIVTRVAALLGVTDKFDPVPKLEKVLRGDPLDYVANADEVRQILARRATA